MKKLFLLLFLFCSIIINGQKGNFRNYTVADGLPQSNIYSLFNDSRGFMWIGSEKGVCCFDGLHYKNFDRKSGLNGTIVRSINEDSFGRLWFGTENGISIFNGKNFYQLDSTKGLGFTIMSIFKTQDAFWVGTSGGGAFVVNNSINPDSIKIRHIELPDQRGASHIFSICSDNKGKIYLGSFAAGIFIINEKKLSLEKNLLKPQIPSDHILCLKLSNNGEIWAGSYDKGAFVFDLQKHKLRIPQQLEDQTVWDIFPTKDNVWFATDQNGVWRESENEWIHFDQSSGLLANQVFKVTDDIEGNVWLAVFGSGLSMFMGNHFEHFDQADGISNRIYGILADASGNLWLASDDQGLLKFNGNSKNPEIRKVSKSNDTEDISARCIAIDQKGNIWTNHSNKGISKFDGSKFHYISANEGLVNDEVNCILPDSKGKIWIGTIGGISIFDGEKFFNIDKKNYGLPNDEISTIIESNDGNIWVGTLSGLIRFSGNQMTTFDETDGLFDKEITSLYSGKNNLWIGTSGGLYSFNFKKDKKITKVADDDLLISSSINGLLLYSEDQLIVATDKGFDIILLNNKNEISRIKHYDKMNGFIGIENKDRALAKDKWGNVWFCTVKGLSKYNPEKEKEYLKAPKLAISSIKLFYESVQTPVKSKDFSWISLPAKLSFKYSQNHISFQFIGISYSDPSKVRYRYKLEGLENDWSPSRNVEEAVYSGLKPGIYTFKVIAVGSNGIWSKEPVSYTFEIKPPFWQKPWFIVLVVIVSILIIFSYMRYRERKLRRDKMILEKIVEERTAEVVKQKDEIELQNIVLEEQKKEITDSINYASLIQVALLPSGKSLSRVFAEHFIIFKPRDIVSGDFYWNIEKDNKVLLIVADCTGHGVPGAFMSMLGISYLNQIVVDPAGAEPALILNELRCKIIAALQHNSGSTTRQDGMDMAIVYYNKEEDFLTYAGANISLFQMTGSSKEMIIYKPDKMPVGTHIRNEAFKNNKVPVHKNDVFFLFSDGYEDQFGGPMNKKFLSKRMKEMFEANYNKPLEEQKQIYTKVIEDWMIDGNISQTDDITVLGFRIE